MKKLIIIGTLTIVLGTSYTVLADSMDKTSASKNSQPQTSQQSGNKAFSYGKYGNYQRLPDYQNDNPAVLLKDAIARVSQFVSKGGVKDVRSLDRFLNEQVAPFFDFEEMSSLVGGKLYHKMDQANQKEFQQRLQILLFDSLTSQLISFDGIMPKISFFRPIMNGNGQMLARLRVLRRNAPPTNLAFRFVKGDKGWKVVDVASNGYSAILYYREYYRNYVQELKLRKRIPQTSTHTSQAVTNPTSKEK